MKIKKLNEEVEYFEKTIKHTFEINGKTVHVIEWAKQDNINNQYAGNTDIEPSDEAKLDDLEAEALGEYMKENLELKIGETFNAD